MTQIRVRNHYSSINVELGQKLFVIESCETTSVEFKCTKAEISDDYVEFISDDKIRRKDGMIYTVSDSYFRLTNSVFTIVCDVLGL